ncbi:MAG: MqnA/MqnD/SBP family protein [Oscillospiraceae bacterium]|nr:MqnA/MqnD/SBP family protein [Oscillospiraceae bacterium]
MKKIISILLVLALVLGAFAACAKTETKPETEQPQTPAVEEGAVLRLASLKGPTTMGLVKLLSDAEAGTLGYTVDSTIYGTADELTGLLVNGDIDAAAIPANLASVLYNKTKGAIKVAAINTLGVLYIVENGETIQSVADLKGKTIYATGKGTTPEYALRSVLTWNGIDPDTDVTIEYKSEATEVAAMLTDENAGEAIAMLPQPYVTTVLLQNPKVRIALDLTEEWKNASGKELVTGVLVVRSDYLDSNPGAFTQFLADYKASTEYVNANPADAAALIEKYGIVAKAAVAEKALPYCNITFIEGSDMRALLENYLTVLSEQNMSSIGGALPDDGFYYGA